MRRLATLALAAALASPTAVHARLFWQTYGSTVASPDGGCAWNLNSDYFVPRHCDSCRYDLFSPCKTAHTRSPACKYLHPVYEGYCTIYGPCHFRWRDHVYKKHCGCAPLRDVSGSWQMDKCRKGSCQLPLLHAAGCQLSICDVDSHGETKLAASSTTQPGCGDCWGETFGVTPALCALPNVEPLGGETLGTIEAFSLGALAGGAGRPPAAGAVGQALPPPSGSNAAVGFSGLFGN
jgi:hypothetical protein